VKTFFDCTPAYLGRDPLQLRELSEKTGIQILINTGYFGARDNLFIPPSAFDATAEDIARAWISLDNVYKNNNDTPWGIAWFVGVLKKAER
jgi:predicted metal-dependent phosphotriesterase family hydrolase